MSCAVRSCRNDMHRLSQLSFFSLPRQNHLKEEWLEVLGIERSANISNIKVCEVHFKPKDFCTGKKQLKTHAVPVLKLGCGKSEPIDSDDEFTEYNSDGDLDVIEVDMENTKESLTLKDDAGQVDKTCKLEPEAEDVEEGRRPSRRAAREAAKKIYNTVRNFMPKNESEYSHSPVTVNSNSSRILSRPKNRSSTKGSSVDVSLIMECHEEILSAAQAEALLKAQLEYNMVMKTLRSLKAQNVKIIVAKDPIVSQASVKSTPLNVVSSTPNVIFQKPQVLPMVLTSSPL